MKVTLADIRKARELISPYLRKTETDLSIGATKKMGSEVFFKYENEQITGSFKLRGALNKILNLSEKEKYQGVVASSAGNHAQGVAYSARKTGVKSTIVMPINAALIKVEATRDYGSDVVLHGDYYDEAYEKARELEKTKGFVFVHPFQDELVIAGQGTIGLEILEAVPDVDTVIVPIGGGGLISGIATAIKALKPSCKVIGVQSVQASGMAQLFHHQELQNPQRISTIADGIAVKRPSKEIYDDFISKLVDEIVTVTDDEIADAIVFLMERSKSVVEGSGAAGVAALFHRQIKLGKKTLALLCGGNIDLNLVAKIIEKGLLHKGRLAELSVTVDDLPGSLHRLTNILATQEANILQVHHDRLANNLFLRETRIDFVVETKSTEHVLQIRKALADAGIKLS